MMLFNQLLDMPHLSGGWMTLVKEKCSLTGMKTNLCTTFEINMGFLLREFISFKREIKSRTMWDTWLKGGRDAVICFVQCKRQDGP